MFWFTFLCSSFVAGMAKRSNRKKRHSWKRRSLVEKRFWLECWSRRWTNNLSVGLRMVSSRLSKSSRGASLDTYLITFWAFIFCFCCSLCTRRRRRTLLTWSNLPVILLFSGSLFFTAVATPITFSSKASKKEFRLSEDGSYLFSYDTGKSNFSINTPPINSNS